MFYSATPLNDDTIAPYKRTVGLEIEVSSGATAASWLHSRGYAPSNRLHDYQCSCRESIDYPVHPTSDCTAPGGEYLIGGPKGVLYGSPRFFKATSIAEQALLAARAETSDSVGMHTHVGMDGLEVSQRRILLRNYLAMQEEFQWLAAGAAGAVRNNGCTSSRINMDRLKIQRWDNYTTSSERMDRAEWDEFWASHPRDWAVNQFPARPTFNFQTGSKGTVEFRIWNSTTVQWRMVLAAGVSSAFVEAAKQERVAPPPEWESHKAAVTMEEFLYDFVTADLIGLMMRQRAAFEARQ